MNNLTAGTGDPYWYEWSVGLLYMVKMINSDSGIKNVVLQSEDSQSLDDVVVTYEDGMIEYIQVKYYSTEYLRRLMKTKKKPVLSRQKGGYLKR